MANSGKACQKRRIFSGSQSVSGTEKHPGGDRIGGRNEESEIMEI